VIEEEKEEGHVEGEVKEGAVGGGTTGPEDCVLQGEV